jgi:single-strand DNA-binding protein
LNNWIGIGNLTDDPEMRYTESGSAVTSFSIAINNGKDKSGEERPPTYIDVVTWEKLAENCAEYLRKGKKCAVSGPITVDKYEDREGVKRTKYRIRAMNVEFLSPRSDDDEQPRRRSSRDDDLPRQQQSSRRSAPRDDLDDLPF